MTLDQVEQRLNDRLDQLERMIKDLHDMNDEQFSEIEPLLILIERFLHKLIKEEESNNG